MIILLACFPKSGSTFVANLFGRLPGFTSTGFVPDGGQREQEIDIAIASQFIGRKCIAQHHVRASTWTKHCVSMLDMKPVVLVRNIADAIVSLSDHMVRESTEMPFAYFDRTFAEMDEPRRLNAIVNLVGPWYFNFYVSWFEYRRDAIVTYEDIVLPGAVGIKRLFDTIGIEASLPEVGMLIETTDRSRTRFNSGTSGRGREKLSAENMASLRRLASFYPRVDFEPIGL